MKHPLPITYVLVYYDRNKSPPWSSSRQQSYIISVVSHITCLAPPASSSSILPHPRISITHLISLLIIPISSSIQTPALPPSTAPNTPTPRPPGIMSMIRGRTPTPTATPPGSRSPAVVKPTILIRIPSHTASSTSTHSPPSSVLLLPHSFLVFSPHLTPLSQAGRLEDHVPSVQDSRNPAQE